MEAKHPIDISQFLDTFFRANHCSIIDRSTQNLKVQLSIEMDKALMNRPFYWQYIEATGRTGTPQTLAFTTKMEDSSESEWIHHGSPRLQQIYDHIKTNNKVIHLFEVCQTEEKTLLHPWLLTNYLVVYEGKLKKEKLYSIGLNLINGAMAYNMMERLEPLNLAPSISPYCYTISPLITEQSGFKRIEQFISEQIAEENHDWANVSLDLMREEIDMVYHFYHQDLDSEQLTKEITEIKNRLQPSITHKVLNGGMLYLSEEFLSRSN